MEHDHVSFSLLFYTALERYISYRVGMISFMFFFFFLISLLCCFYRLSHDDNGIVFILHAVRIIWKSRAPGSGKLRGRKRRERGQPWDISVTFQTMD